MKHLFHKMPKQIQDKKSGHLPTTWVLKSDKGKKNGHLMSVYHVADTILGEL